MLTERNRVESTRLERSSRHRAHIGRGCRTRVANLFVGLGLMLVVTASCSDNRKQQQEQPAHQSLPFLNLGCSRDSDCDDANQCTLDVCVANVACVNAAILNCCLTNEECQNRLGCALAECVLGECVQLDSCETSSGSGATGTGGGPIGVGLTVIGIGVSVGIDGVGVTAGVGGAAATSTTSGDASSNTQGSGGTGGATGSGDATAAGGAPTTSSGTGGAGGTPCEEDEQCAADCVIGYCINGFCATAPDPLCCDEPADCAGIRCATGDCVEGRCHLDCSGSGGASGAAGEAGAAGQAGAESTGQGGAATTQNGGATATGSGGTAAVSGGAGGTGGTSNAGGTTGQGGSGQQTTRGGSGGTTKSPAYELRGGACSVGVGRRAGGGWALVGLMGLMAMGAWARRRRKPPTHRAPVRGRVSSALWISLAALGISAPTPAFAQGSAIDEYPAPSAPDDLLWIERATPRPGDVVPFARLGLVYSKNPLVAEMSDGSEISIIDQRLAFYGSAGVALADRFSGAIAVPVYAQNGESLSGASEGASSGIGDVALDLRVAALTRRAPVEVGLGLGLQFPSGSQDELSGERTTSARPRVIVSKAIGTRGSLLTGHAGSRVRGATDLGDVRLESELDLGLGGLWMFTDALGVSGEFGLRTSYRDFFAEQETPASATGGVRYQHGWVVLHGGAGAGLTSGVGAPDLRLLAMIGVAPPAGEASADRDGDGVPDALDQCPDAPEDNDGIADSDGCPEDDDDDGVPDAVDACPKVAEDKDGFEDDDGCPDPDNDGDGVADADDRCLNQAEDKDGFEDEDGCPDPDNDRDGVLDGQDECPLEAEDQDGWQDHDGCPDPDNDGDGIPDSADKCPKEAETLNGVDDDDGCPDFIRVEDGEIRTLEPIFFEYGQSRIQQRSEPMLAEMARTIAARPDLGTISIEGHTDDRGDEGYNLRLSQGRAEAVRRFLIDAGVPSERLIAKGFGETQPIVSNATDAGRATNRRVQFRFALPDEAAPEESPP